MRERRDIRAPDGYLLGGERVVREDGTILFNRGWWQLPTGFAEQGEYVWVHEKWIGGTNLVLEVAPSGYTSIYAAQLGGETINCERTKRPDAKPSIRNPARKAWHERKAAQH